MKHLKTLFPLFLVVILNITNEWPCLAGSEVQNGGAGIKRYGKILPFGSAKVTLNKEPLTFDDIPGLPLLFSTIKKMDLTLSAQNVILIMIA